MKERASYNSDESSKAMFVAGFEIMANSSITKLSTDRPAPLNDSY